MLYSAVCDTGNIDNECCIKVNQCFCIDGGGVMPEHKLYKYQKSKHHAPCRKGIPTMYDVLLNLQNGHCTTFEAPGIICFATIKCSG